MPEPNAATLQRELSRLRGYAEYLDWLDAHLGRPHATPGAGTEGDARFEAHDPLASQRPNADRGGAGRPVQPVPREPGARFRLGSSGPECVVLPAGTVQAGAHPQDSDAETSERPQRLVRLAHPLAISLAPITFEQWDACRADDGTRHRPGDATWGRGNRPVMNVSWHDAEEYCGWLSRQTGLHCRLPTEAEWLHAFWAGRPQTERFPWGHDPDYRQLRHHAWFTDNAQLRTQPVGQLEANPWGLVDLLGNVAEWVADAWHPDLAPLPEDGRPMPSDTRRASRVIKGGSWLESARSLRPSARDHFHPDHRSYRVGFRVVVALP